MSELRRLGEIINPALAKLETSDRARAYGLWARAAGDLVVANARPRAFARGLLTLECASSIWANELTYLAPQILARMTALEPGNPVERLRFFTGRTPFAQGGPPAAAEVSPRPSEASEGAAGSPPSGSPRQVSVPIEANREGRERHPRDADVEAAVEAARDVGDERLRAAILATLDRSPDRPRTAPADGPDVNQK